MNWYKTFYWVTRADSVKDFFDSASNWFLFFTLISAIAYIVCSFNLANTISENGTTTPDEDAKDSGVRAWKMARRYSAGLFYPMLGLLQPSSSPPVSTGALYCLKIYFVSCENILSCRTKHLNYERQRI